MYYEIDNDGEKYFTDHIEFTPTAYKGNFEDLLDIEISDEVWSEMCEQLEFYDYFDWDIETAYGGDMDMMLKWGVSSDDVIDMIKSIEEEIEKAEA